MRSLGSRSVVAPLGQAQRKRKTSYLTSNTEAESRQVAGEQDFADFIFDSFLRFNFMEKHREEWPINVAWESLQSRIP